MTRLRHPADAGDLLLFDGIAPFFAGLPAGETNWSKVPFARLERDGVLAPERAAAIRSAWDHYLGHMAGLGYSAVAVDDLAHLVSHPWYPASLRRLLASYRDLYRDLFATAARHGIAVFAISDYCFFNDAIERHLARTGASDLDFFDSTFAAALRDFPSLAGLVLRLGESDGVDVRDHFTSRLSVARPRQARHAIERLLHTAERAGATLMVRTWTLGAYPVGDLMWNPRTWDAVFGGLDSPNLVVSLKHGEADFFRYLDVNPLLFRGPLRKVVEFQARREYEGMGEFPAFAGWLHERHLARLRQGGARLAGCYVIQAGGWASWSRLAFVASGSVWNELNTAVIARLWQGVSCEDAVREWSAARLPPGAEPDLLLEFLALADRAIERGLYIRAFAESPAYVRRVRLPPLLWVFWQDVTATGLIAMLHRFVVRDRAAAVRDGHAAVADVEAMRRLAPALGLPVDDLDFQLESFRLLARAREILLGLDSAETWQAVGRLLPAYRSRYPDGYRFTLTGRSRPRAGLLAALGFRLVLRRSRRYRLRE
ncbi:MAG: hypothetical protein ACKOWF_01635, partial [Chloroflexota bacterium]